MLKAVSASKPRNKLVHNHAVETLSVSLHPVPAVTNIPFCCQTLRSFSPSPSTTALRANTRECLKGSEQPELLSLQGRQQQLPAGAGTAPWWLEGGERPWAQAQSWSQQRSQGQTGWAGSGPCLPILLTAPPPRAAELGSRHSPGFAGALSNQAPSTVWLQESVSPQDIREVEL